MLRDVSLSDSKCWNGVHEYVINDDRGIIELPCSHVSFNLLDEQFFIRQQISYEEPSIDI